MTKLPPPERVVLAEDELSRLETTKTHLPFDKEAFAEAARQTQKDNFWPAIAKRADECDAILTENNFPKVFDFVAHDGSGHWWHATAAEIVAQGLTAMAGWKFSELNAEGFSDPWYAATIGFACREALRLAKRGEGSQHHAFALIYKVGAFNADWQWRRNHKKSVLRGKKTLKVAHDGGEMRRNALAVDTQKRLAAMELALAEKPGLGVSHAAELAFKRGHGPTAKANRQLFYRHKGK
jgi:hypothetical protein